jgi:hypothetical protein
LVISGRRRVCRRTHILRKQPNHALVGSDQRGPKSTTITQS